MPPDARFRVPCEMCGNPTYQKLAHHCKRRAIDIKGISVREHPKGPPVNSASWAGILV
jgi:hypothetical protein